MLKLIAYLMMPVARRKDYQRFCSIISKKTKENKLLSATELRSLLPGDTSRTPSMDFCIKHISVILLGRHLSQDASQNVKN